MMSDDDRILEAFLPLWSDIDPERDFATRKPLLAHYTSIENLEKILVNNEIWFSNPLYMNDFDELRFVMNEAQYRVWQHKGLKSAIPDAKKYKQFLSEFDNQMDLFSHEEAFDVYVFCFTEHAPNDHDGLLSMWRGYGGDGNGAAIVFDSSRLEPQEDSAMTLAEVNYATTEQRLNWIDKKLSQFADILVAQDLPEDKFYLPVYSLVERLKAMTFFSKHSGFSEEREWRAVYSRNNDDDDRLKEMLHYSVGTRGVEPKLKFKIGPIDGITGSELNFDDLIHSILLGPRLSDPLSIKSAQRMLESMGRPGLIEKLRYSSTPYRPVGRR